jgi:hypothetical protein
MYRKTLAIRKAHVPAVVNCKKRKKEKMQYYRN